jgi:hypothetical protein
MTHPTRCVARALCNAAKGRKPFGSFEDAYEFLRNYRANIAPKWFNDHVESRRSQWSD